MQATESKLTVENVSKTYRGAGGGENVTALRDVGIEIGDGEFVSIVGPSGCGKSTLFNIIAGLVKPSSGRVLLDGDQPDDLLGKVGYMPQRDMLMPWRTVLDNTTLGLELNGMKKSEAHKVALGEFEPLRPGRLREAVAGQAVGRHEAARRAAADLPRRPRTDAAGRAFRRTRRADPGADAGAGCWTSGRRTARRSCS